METVPVSQIFFLGNKIESSNAQDETVIMLALIVSLPLVPSVRDFVSVAPFPSEAFIGDVSYGLHPAVECCLSSLPAGLDPQPS